MSLFTSLQNLVLFTNLSKTYSNVSSLLEYSFLVQSSAISLISVLSTFLKRISVERKKKSSSVKSAECAAQEIEPPRPIHLPLNFSFCHVRNSLEKWGGASSCYKIILLLSPFLCTIGQK